MGLKYKISISILLISLTILSLISVIYSQWSYKTIMEREKKSLLSSAVESARYIEVELLDKLSNTLTISSAPIVSEMLKNSNLEYKTLTDEQKLQKIDKLNRRWMKAEDEKDSFVTPYLNNKLALFLKKQQSILKGVYGEIFITNKYGAMIASTGKLTTLAHAKKYWWKKSFSDGNGAIFFDDRGFDASVGGYVIGVTVPVMDGDKVIGILKANVNIISTLKGIVSHYKNMNHGALKVVRTKGLVVYEENLPPLSTSINPLLLKNIQTLEAGTEILKEYAQESLMAYAPIRLSINNKNIGFGGKVKTQDHVKGNDRELWHTVISYPKNLALAESIQTNKMIIFIGLFIAFLSAIVAFITGRWISKPVEELQIAQLKLQEQEEIMIAQSRHAAMGEMISMIAHQWRQPISVIAMGANNILADIELDMVDEVRLKKGAYSIVNQTQELSRTIDDFRNFFRPEKELEDTLVEDIFNNVFTVVGKSLDNYNIEVIKEFHNAKIKTYPRELMQVFINIIKNSKEAIVENSSKDKKIFIKVNKTQNDISIKICDTGGGIKDEILNKIFDPYFSTKSAKNGTGIGLYMSKTIVQKHLNGTLRAYNIDNGICLEISLPLDIENFGDSDE